MMHKVCCFGELLLRMSPALNKEWIYASGMAAYIGGAELNVASALAKWNIPVKYFTALPDNYLSKEIMEYLEENNIDTSAIHISGDRIGAYYLPQGTDLKHAGVIYDRAHSSFFHLQPGMVNWDEVLDGCTWFHFSAISPAINENAAAVCKEALEAASAKGLTISVDLNHRSKLWKYGKDPVEVMTSLVEYCDVIMGNMWAAETLLGTPSPVPNSIGKTKQELVDAAGQSMLVLHRQYPKAQTFAYTFRLDHEYFSILQHGGDRTVSNVYSIDEVKDKVGTGDCFMAGLIYGLYNQQPLKEIIDFASAAAVGKLYETGDSTNQHIEDVKKIINHAK
jgi:2-dehydro-3-deoxygluconokinase